MITKRQIRINYIEEININIDGKSHNYYQISKKLFEAFGQSFCHDHKKGIRINYIEEISIKMHAKKVKYYEISKKLL